MAAGIASSAPRLILFDYGGVVADHYCQPYLNQLSMMLGGVNEQRVLSELSETTEHGKLYRLNRMSLHEFWAIVGHRLNSCAFEAEEAQLLWAGTYIPNCALLSLIQFLRQERSVLTGLVLNEDAPRLQNLLKLPCNLAGYFDTIYASCNMGWIKPKPEFYQHILDTNPWAYSASQILVIDDRESHVQVPARLGFQTYRYTTPGDCNLYLTKLYNYE